MCKNKKSVADRWVNGGQPDALSVDHLGHIIRVPLFFPSQLPLLFFLCVYLVYGPEA